MYLLFSLMLLPDFYNAYFMILLCLWCFLTSWFYDGCGDFYFLFIPNDLKFHLCLFLLILKTWFIFQKTNCAVPNNCRFLCFSKTMSFQVSLLLNVFCQLHFMQVFYAIILLNLNLISWCPFCLFLCPGLFIALQIRPS